MTLILPRVNGPKPRSSLNAWYYVVITSKNQWRFPEKLTTSERDDYDRSNEQAF